MLMRDSPTTDYWLQSLWTTGCHKQLFVKSICMRSLFIKTNIVIITFIECINSHTSFFRQKNLRLQELGDGKICTVWNMRLYYLFQLSCKTIKINFFLYVIIPENDNYVCKQNSRCPECMDKVAILPRSSSARSPTWEVFKKCVSLI